MWSTLVGLIRLISERIDPVTSVTLLYSLSTLILLILFKIPKLNKIPKQYLLLATLLFVSYELCFSFSITLANNSQQAIEVGVLNHLWPSLTILLMVVFKEIKFHALLILGLSSALFGIIYTNQWFKYFFSSSHAQSNRQSIALYFGFGSGFYLGILLSFIKKNEQWRKYYRISILDDINHTLDKITIL